MISRSEFSIKKSSKLVITHELIEHHRRKAAELRNTAIHDAMKSIVEGLLCRLKLVAENFTGQRRSYAVTRRVATPAEQPKVT